MKAAFVVVAASAALGAGAGASAVAAESGFYAGAGAAVIEPSVGMSDGLTIMLPAFPFPIGVPPTSITNDGTEAGWNVMLGYRIHRFLAGELEYSDYGSIGIHELYDLADALPVPVEPPVAISDTASHVRGPVISLLGILPISEEFEFFVRVGVLFASQEVNLTDGPGVFRGPRVSYSEEQWVAGVGIDCAMSRRWKARFEYQAVERFRANAIIGPVRLDRFAFGVTYDF